MKFRLLTSLLFLFLYFFAASAQNTDILLQGFNWDSHSNTNGWYNVVGSKAAELGAAQFDMVWMPPPSDAAAPQGYLPRELYVLNSAYGTQAELQQAINSLHANNIKVLADIVINHRVGTTNWADFTNPTWGCWAVTANDEWGSNGGNPCGGNDTGDNYSAARDVDHTNATVQSDITAWMNWLKNTIGFDGWRYDYVRGYSGYYNKLYDDGTGSYFSVGELWDNLDLNNVNAHRQQIVDWVNATQGRTSAFDFTTKGVLQQAVNGELWRLSINGGAPGVIGWWPAKAVTFIDNHDTGSSQNYWPFPGGKVMQGYAYILTHPGLPSVFWDHYFDWGLKAEIDALIEVRKDNGIHTESNLVIKAAQANLYAAEIDGKVAMKIGSDSWSPSGSGWVLRTYGTNYAVWDKQTPPPPPTNNFTVYFKRPAGWSGTPKIHYWGAQPQGSLASTNWPGVNMTLHCNDWYKFEFTGISSVNLLFHNNAGSQTADLSRSQDGWYSNGSWSNSDPGDCGTGSIDLRIHFKPTSYGNPKIYFWNASPSGLSTGWPGESMTAEGNGWYVYTFANTTCTNFIFSNNGASQSPDLNTCTEVWVNEGDWGNYQRSIPEIEIDTPVRAHDLVVTNYPNPFQEGTTLEFDLPQSSLLNIRVFKANGQQLAVLAEGAFDAGKHQLQVIGQHWPTGVYWCRMEVGTQIKVVKLVKL